MTTDQAFLLSVRRAMALLQVSRSTLHMLIKNGDLRVVRIGRAVRIANTEIQRFIAANQQ